jgi:hypothetical protein
MFEFAALIFKFLGGDVAKSLVAAYQAHLNATTSDKQTAANVAAQEIAAQTAETQAITQYRIAEIGHWYEPDKLMGYLVAFLLGKIIVWDICLGFGVTSLHDGWMTNTANTIVMFYFGKRGFENVARIIKAR